MCQPFKESATTLFNNHQHLQTGSSENTEASTTSLIPINLISKNEDLAGSLTDGVLPNAIIIPPSTPPPPISPND